MVSTPHDLAILDMGKIGDAVINASEWQTVELQIEGCSDGTFSPTDGGFEAVAVAARDWRGQPYDLVAWPPANPGRWWTRRGHAQIVGERALHLADWRNTPIHLYETPASWLSAKDEAGVVILDWQSDPRFLLRSVSAVDCESEELERRIWAAIHEHSRPHFAIRVRRLQDAA